ncbi:hypothetical protein BGZ49_002419 [Haplosporangium sp. Z 27]|nr:hypothetical protein BGZ49_002419 [Haplosporangium sp. Z 27]
MSATVSCSSVLAGLYYPYQHDYIEHSMTQKELSSSSNKINDILSASSPSSPSSDMMPTLHEVLLDQVGGPYSLENFADFLQAQFCYENLAFWLTSRQYKLAAMSLSCSIREISPQFNLHQDSLQYLNRSQTRLFSDLQSEMLVILETFILPDSPFELNLSGTTRSKLLKAVTDGDYHPHILESVQDSVTELMKNSSFPLFLESISSRGGDGASLCSSSTSVISGSSSSSSSSTFSHDDNDRDRGSWRVKAKDHFKLVSRALKKTSSLSSSLSS